MEIRNILDVPHDIAREAHDAATRQFVEFPESTKILTLAATIGNKLCAVGSLGSSDLTYGPHSDKGPWVADLWVSREFRGRGVARALVGELLGLQGPSGTI